MLSHHRPIYHCIIIYKHDWRARAGQLLNLQFTPTHVPTKIIMFKVYWWFKILATCFCGVHNYSFWAFLSWFWISPLMVLNPLINILLCHHEVTCIIHVQLCSCSRVLHVCCHYQVTVYMTPLAPHYCFNVNAIYYIYDVTLTFLYNYYNYSGTSKKDTLKWGRLCNAGYFCNVIHRNTDEPLK